MREDQEVPRSAVAAPAFDPLTAVRRGWLTVVGATVGAMLVTGVFLLVVPPDYTAQAVLVQAAYERAGASAGAQLPGALAGLVAAANPQQQMLSVVLKSHAVRERIVKAEEKRTPAGDLWMTLTQKTAVERRADDGAIVVSVSARDPEAAARIANLFPGAINDVIGVMANQAATRKQNFLNAQVTDARESLARAEERMLQFQQTRGVSEPEATGSRTVDAAVELQQTILTKELEVARLRRTATPDNPRLRAAVADLGALRSQLRDLTSSGGGGTVFTPLNEGPALRVASARLLREFKEDETVYATLAAALAQARIEANNNLPVVTALDPAIVPTSPSRSSKRNLMVAALLGFIGSSALVIALAFIKARNAETA